MNGFIQPIDVARRLLFRKRFWHHGKPTIALTGEEGGFGKLAFDFGDEVVEFTIFVKDREAILDAAHMAVENFNELVRAIWNDEE